MERTSLKGLRVLVLEDEALVSMLLEDMLGDLHCEVVGPFREVADAEGFLAAHATGVDIAIIDVNVGGSQSYALAEALAGLGVAFVFSTGYEEAAIDARWRDRPLLRKPFMLRDVEAALAAVAPRAVSG